MRPFIANPKIIVYSAGGAVIGYALSNNLQGAIIGGIIGFIISLRF